MFSKNLLYLLVILLAGCTAVPDTEIATVIPARTPIVTVQPTAVTLATFTPSPTVVATAVATLTPAPTLDDFLASLQNHLNQRNFEALENMMRPTFITGMYPTVTGHVAAAAVTARLRSRLLPLQPQVVFQEVAEAALPETLTADALFANGASQVKVLGSSGWGLVGSGNGLLYVIEEDGVYRWAGLVLTYGDFSTSPTLESIVPPAGLIYEDSGHSWWQIDTNGQPKLLIQPHARITLNPGATMALAAEADSQSVTLFRFPEQITETIPLDGHLMLDPSSIPWLDEDTAVLSITEEGDVSQDTTGYLALLNTQTGQLTPLEPEVSVYTQLSVTAEGTIVYGVTPGGELLIWRDGAATAVPIAGLSDESEYYFKPVLSPDGSKVSGAITTGSEPYTFAYVVAGMEQPEFAIVLP